MLVEAGDPRDRPDRGTMKRRERGRREHPTLTFRTTCPTCGEVDVEPEALFLSILDEDATLGGYGFVCATCGESVWKEGHDRSGALMLLLIAGLEPIQATAERLLHDSASGR
jgi:hypothetical protein